MCVWGGGGGGVGSVCVFVCACVRVCVCVVPIFLLCMQGEYEIVANDYDKAKTLFANTKVSVFKKGI